MSTLQEIEAAAAALPLDEQQKLMLFLGAQLRDAGRDLPAPRIYPSDQISEWVAQDEADLRRLNDRL